MSIKFFRKNKLDLTNTLVDITVSDASAYDSGNDYTDLMRNRNNVSGWMTTDSVDGGSTTMVVDFGQSISATDILLIGNNFKNYNVKYHDGTSYINFPTAIDRTDNTASTNYHTFAETNFQLLQLKVNGTQVPDQDKFLKQFIVTELMGTFIVEPEVQPQFDKDRKVTKFLSGKSYVAKSVGGFNCRFKMKNAGHNDSDFTLLETLFDSYEGFLVWLCGGDESQFEYPRHGYRLEDIFFMDVTNEYTPEYVESRWANGLPIDLKLVEVS